jgi:hypothetical protein
MNSLRSSLFTTKSGVFGKLQGTRNWLRQVDDFRTFLAHFVSAVQQSGLPGAIAF